jgi:hypothetical protein
LETLKGKGKERKGKIRGGEESNPDGDREESYTVIELMLR